MKPKNPKGDFDPIEDSGSEFENWPNEKMLWWRLAFCVLVGLAIAVGFVSLAVMLVNKIMEP